MIYLDNGATTFPKPKGMIEAMDACMSRYCGNPGRSGHDLSRRTGEEIYRARNTLARFFKIKRPERIIFTGSTTEALNLGIKGVLKEGDHVITTSMEHNSVLRPIRSLLDRGVEYTIVPCGPEGRLDVSFVKDAVRENTRLIVCTQASNVTGTIQPVQELAELCGQRGILFLVDGAQGAGHLPLTADGLDMLAVPGHKGLMGPLGTGFLYVREGVELAHLMEGGTGTASREIRQPRELPEGYEVGTLNAPGIIGLGYSTAFVEKIGIEEIRGHQQQLTRVLDEGLRNIRNVEVYGPSDCGQKVGIVAFNIKGCNCEEVASLLNDEYGIAVRSGYHCAGLAHKTIGTWETGAVRMSMGIYNNVNDMKTAVEAVNQIAARMN